MEKGFIKLFHKFDEWEWYDNPSVKVLFIHLLLKANIKTKQWQGLTVKRGQLVTSVEKLAAANGLTIQQTRTALNNMRITNEIEIQTTNRYSIITVKNYNLYQANNKQSTNKIEGGNNKPNTTQITTTKDNTINTSINNSLSLEKKEKPKITKEEREILKSFSKKNGAKNIRAYVSKLIENGDYLEILESEKKMVEKKRAEQARFIEEKKQEEQKPELTEEERQAALERAREIAGITQKRRVKK